VRQIASLVRILLASWARTTKPDRKHDRRGVSPRRGFWCVTSVQLPAVLAAWAIGGVLALAGALSYAELAAALPSNGGEYRLLTRIYHPAAGFVSGWVSLIVGFSAPTAASALALGAYVESAVPGIPALAAALPRCSCWRRRTRCRCDSGVAFRT
jgi:hypothetical protein